nr:hypothetical protein CFP56_14513 [Quercus suber]
MPFPQQSTLFPTSTLSEHTAMSPLSHTEHPIFKPSVRLSFSALHFSASTALDPSIVKRAEGGFRGSSVVPHLELQKPKRRNPVSQL